jgi:hypothetical protein
MRPEKDFLICPSPCGEGFQGVVPLSVNLGIAETINNFCRFCDSGKHSPIPLHICSQLILVFIKERIRGC